MTVVYLDAFLVLNFVVNYLLLACAGKLDGEPVGRGRTALAAARLSGAVSRGRSVVKRASGRRERRRKGLRRAGMPCSRACTVRR